MLTALKIIHLLSAIVWVGGTIVLVFVGVPAIRKLDGEARATALRALGRRWRPLGWSAMGVAVLSGLWLTDRHGGFDESALSTTFDKTLIAKSVLVVFLCVSAVVHDYILYDVCSARFASSIRPRPRPAGGSSSSVGSRSRSRSPCRYWAQWLRATCRPEGRSHNRRADDHAPTAERGSQGFMGEGS